MKPVQKPRYGKFKRTEPGCKNDAKSRPCEWPECRCKGQEIPQEWEAYVAYSRHISKPYLNQGAATMMTDATQEALRQALSYHYATTGHANTTVSKKVVKMASPEQIVATAAKFERFLTGKR